MGLDNLYATYWRDWSALEARSDDSLLDSWDRDVTSLLKRIQSILLKFNPARLPEQDRISYEWLRYRFVLERRPVHFSRGK